MNPVKHLHIFLNHLIHPFQEKRNQYNTKKHSSLYCINFVIWLILIPIKFLEIIGFSFLLNLIFKSLSKTRQLTPYEVQELKSVFKDSITYSEIHINESSRWARLGSKTTKTNHLGFVWMHTVNFTKCINCQNKTTDMAWLIHEIVHISQFNTLGFQYIFEALIAQHIGGYSYGGVEELKKKKPLNHYNLEQQAELIKHYYLDQNNKLYTTFASDLINHNF